MAYLICGCPRAGESLPCTPTVSPVLKSSPSQGLIQASILPCFIFCICQQIETKQKYKMQIRQSWPINQPRQAAVVLLVHLCRPCKHHLFDPCIISVIISTNCIRRPCSMTTDTPKSRPGVQPDILSFLTCQSGYYGGGIKSAKRNRLLAAP